MDKDAVITKIFPLKNLHLLSKLFYLGDLLIFRYRVFDVDFTFHNEIEYFPEETPFQIFGDFFAVDLLEKLRKVGFNAKIEISVLNKDFIFYKNFWLFGSFGIYQQSNKFYLYTSSNPDPYINLPSKILITELTTNDIDEIYNFILSCMD